MWSEDCIRWCFAGGRKPEGEHPTDDDSELKRVALKHVERRRGMKFHLAAFGLGLLILGGPWVGIEYLNEGWPDRVRANGQPGDWNPAILVILMVWALLLAIHGLRLYYRRPYTESEVDRELGRLRRDRA